MTSCSRAALASARGTRMTSAMAIISDIRICMMYMRKAVMLPMGIAPLSTRRPPNHRIATVVRFITASTAGNATTKIRLTRSAVDMRSSLASSNRLASKFARMKARMTRTPMICSRRTWLILSIFTCIERKSGMALKNMNTTISARSGMTTISTAES